MSPEELQSLLFGSHSELQFPSSQASGPQDIRFVLSQPSLPSAENDPDGNRQRPRGGRKPLRAWQQQLSALQAEFAQKELDLKRAQEEGERLRQRLKVLEAVLPIREQLSKLLLERRHGSGGQAQDRAAPSLNVIEELQTTSSGGTSTSDTDTAPAREHWQHHDGRNSSFASASNQHAPAGPGAAKCAAAAAAAPPAAKATRIPLRKGWVCSDAIVPRSAAAAAAAEAGTAAAVNGFVPFSSILPNNRPPPHAIKDLCTFWDRWVRDAALTLHAHDARPHDPQVQRQMLELRQQLYVVFGPLRIEYPLLLTELICVNLKTGEQEEPPQSFWVPVAKGLRFSADQVAACKAALALCQERMDKIMEERRGLLVQLARAIAARSNWIGRTGGTCSEPHLTEDLTAQLYRNVLMEGHAVEVLKDFMGSSLFSLVQMLRASVLSYPYFPDGVAILSTIAATCSHSPEPAGGV